MFEWKNLFRGLMIGTTDLVPGISGGTIAVILGIYSRLIEAISGLFSRQWKQYLGFLIPLGIGAVTAILLLSRAMKWLLAFYPQPTFFFFIGLILGIVPYLFKTINYKKNFRWHHYFWILFFCALVALLRPFSAGQSNTIIEVLTASSAITLFFSGWLASMATLLPGISGSLVLLIIGAYDTIINALATFNLPIMFVVGCGIVIGFIISSKAIRYLINTAPIFTYAAIIGMVVGSVFVIFPVIENDISLLILSLVTFIVGFYVAVFLGKYEINEQ